MTVVRMTEASMDFKRVIASSSLTKTRPLSFGSFFDLRWIFHDVDHLVIRRVARIPPQRKSRDRKVFKTWRFLARVWLRTPIREQFRRSLNRLPLPVRHLAGMQPVIRSNFLNGLLFLDGLQRDSCFHFRAEASPLPRFHLCSLSEAAILHLNEWSECWGALHSARSHGLWDEHRSGLVLHVESVRGQ